MTTPSKPVAGRPAPIVVGGNIRPPSAPKGALTRPRANGRPAALPMPSRRDVQAFTAPSRRDDFDRIAAEAAGVRALTTGDNVIGIFEDIGEDWWTGGGVTAKKIASTLRAIGDRPVEVQINSDGGDMFEGIAIYNVLREHPQPITVKIMGMAASAASIIAMAGDRIEIGSASFLMIHNCWVLGAGNRNALRELADWLEPFDQAMVDLYAQRTGQDAKDIAKWLDAETYLSGTQAIDKGFADALLPADAVKTDSQAKARAHDRNAVRSMELALVSTGYSRTDARALIKQVKGTPGAAQPTGTPGAAGSSWATAALALADKLNP